MVDSTLISAETSIATLNSELVGYRIRRQVGHGAMGIVFEAEQKNLGRRVAIKILPPNLALRDRTVKRFLREAESMGRLGHANIVDVYEVGSVRSTHFFSMRYVEGPPLDRVLKAGPLPVHDVLAIGIDVASALSHAHSRGVMHRDVKPSNLLRDGERVLLTDFGLARALDGEDEGTMTESGDLVGTPLYMAPEQISGDSDNIDGRADVWGLGVTLYELLTQKPPFTALNAQGILHAILHREPPRLSRVRADVPSDLEAVIHRCLEKDQARRYSGSAALLEDLEAVRDGKRVTARKPRFFDPIVRWMRRHPVEAGIVVASLLVTVSLAAGIRFVWTLLNNQLSDANVETEQAKVETKQATHGMRAASAHFELSEALIARFEAIKRADAAAQRAAEERALDLLGSRALDAHPEIQAEVLMLLAGWLSERGHSPELVISELEGWVGERDLASARAFRAAIRTGLGDFAGALFAHRERSSAAPLDPRPLLDAARVLRKMALAARSRSDETGFARALNQALVLLDRALELAFRTPNREVAITILIERARCRLDVPVAELAKRDLLLALREDPTRVDAQSMLSLAERSLDQRGEASPLLLDDPAVRKEESAGAATPAPANFKSGAQDVNKLFELFRKLVPKGASTPSNEATQSQRPRKDGDKP